MRIVPFHNQFLFLGVANASTGPGAPIIQWTFSAGDDQVWTRHYVKPGQFEFINKNSGLCMFADGIAGDWIYQEPCDGSAAELFYTNLPGRWGQDSYLVQSVLNPSLFLDIDGGSANQGTHLIQWYWHHGGNQFFIALAGS